MKTITETRMSKWAEKRAQIEKEAKEIADAIRNESAKVFDDMFDSPLETLEEIFKI